MRTARACEKTFRERERGSERNFRRTFSSLPRVAKKGQENRASLLDQRSISGEQRLLTRGSGEVSAKSCDDARVRPPNVSGVSQVGDHRMNFEVAKPDCHLARAFKNWSRFARLRSAVQMIVDVGT
jgi:hypothetical protein